MTAKQQAALLQSMVKSSPDVNPGKGPKWQRQSRRKGGTLHQWFRMGKPKAGLVEHQGPRQGQEHRRADEVVLLNGEVDSLRHENQQSIDRSQKGFVLFCQARGLLSVVPDLKKTAEV